jgi:hypothetical protein
MQRKIKRLLWSKRSRYIYVAFIFLWLMAQVDSGLLGQLGNFVRIGFLSLALYCSGIALGIIKPVHEEWLAKL